MNDAELAAEFEELRKATANQQQPLTYEYATIPPLDTGTPVSLSTLGNHNLFLALFTCAPGSPPEVIYGTFPGHEETQSPSEAINGMPLEEASDTSMHPIRTSWFRTMSRAQLRHRMNALEAVLPPVEEDHPHRNRDRHSKRHGETKRDWSNRMRNDPKTRRC
jgi:hypothetical protein